ncbi:hypothetical protein [Roseovarius sp. MBR-6]|jgi:hypothetical protein|uniref:hypothetical protein n=1 Tax=Roseovarius sp. MBR-6 TaxID=3156459 RepID=UPI003390E484
MTNIPLVRRRQAVSTRWPLSRRQTVIVATVMVGAGLWLNWGWVAAIGAAPLILSLAPCAVMCATGYCVMCKSKGCDADKTPTTATEGRGQ